MSQHSVVLIPGDGIGLETSAAMKQVVAASGAEIEWVEAVAGAACIEKYGTPLPEETIELVKEYKTAIKGPVTTPVGQGFRSVNVALRKALDLYINLRPVLSIPGAGGRYTDVDLIIVRENSEDLYAGIEFEEGAPDTEELICFIDERDKGCISKDSAISLKPISIHASNAIVEFAFDYAMKNNRKLVTAVHKANIMKCSDGLFLRCARDVASEYEGKIDFNDKIIDALCMNLVMNPAQFDVLVLPNLYGDIVSDLAAGLVGGLGLAPGANIGSQYAVFEAVHGSAPDIAGKNLANPTAQILSAAMMLDHLDEQEQATRIRNAIKAVYAKGEHLTADIRQDESTTGSAAISADRTPATCTEFTEAVIRELEER